MADPAPAPNEEPETPEVAERRLDVATELLEEARAAIERQSTRLDDMRQRSITLASLLTPAVLIAAGIADDASGLWLIVAGIALAVALLAAAAVQAPQAFIEAPDLAKMTEVQYREAHQLHQVRRDLAAYHYKNWQTNNAQALRRVPTLLTAQVSASAVAAVAVMVAVAA